jgi:predicted transcriptional regulator
VADNRIPLRTFRAPDDLWQRARAVAAVRDESLSDVIRAALERYVRRHGITPPPQERTP